MPKVRSILKQEVTEILLNEWDPIGVQEFPELYRKKAADEYDMYIDPLIDMLLARKPRLEVANFLYETEIRNMGGRRDRASADAAAESLAKIEL